MLRRLIIGLIGSAFILAVAACDGTAAIGMLGPEQVDSDEEVLYVAAIDGATPYLAFADWWWYIDLDGDNWPDRNEILDTDRTEVDRFGTASSHVWFTPEEFFGDNPVPSKMTVAVRAQVYWSNFDEGYQTLRDEMAVRVNTDN